VFSRVVRFDFSSYLENMVNEGSEVKYVGQSDHIIRQSGHQYESES